MRIRLYISGIALGVTLVAFVPVLVLVASPSDEPEAAPPPLESSDELPPVTTPLPERESDAEQEDEQEGEGQVRLRAPNALKLKLDLKLPTREGHPYEALALYFRTSFFAGPARKLDVIGFARRGARIPVKRGTTGKGCRKGRWYQVQGGGYVCTSRGFLVGTKPRRLDLPFALPDLKKLLPHRYGKVTRDEAERLFRIPTPQEDRLIAAAAATDGGLPDVVEKAMKGIYFVAVDHEETSEGRKFYRTVRGRYVRKEDVELRATPRMHGEWLGKEGKDLPLAFVFDKDRPLYRLEDSQLLEVGTIEKHARFHPARTLKQDGRTLLQTEVGFLVDKEHVRLVRKTARPTDIPAGEKWIHVDLEQQTLVAYEHDRAVFATLVSSGKEGFEPPLGIFRIHKKYISTTMNGPDPDDGWYEVEEVPWTMYYWESYALHGTYWHNDFGKSRSHGCTNVAPADAKWLFYWSEPGIHYGWHALEKRGTRVYFTK
jgi:hypothetical protein